MLKIWKKAADFREETGNVALKMSSYYQKDKV